MNLEATSTSKGYQAKIAFKANVLLEYKDSERWQYPPNMNDLYWAIQNGTAKIVDGATTALDAYGGSEPILVVQI